MSTIQDYTLLTLEEIDALSQLDPNVALERAQEALRYFVTMLPSWGVSRGQLELLELPIELLFEIFRFLDLKSLLSLRLCNSRFYEIIWGTNEPSSYLTRNNPAGAERLLQAFYNSTKGLSNTSSLQQTRLPPLGESITLGPEFGGELKPDINPEGVYVVTGYRFTVQGIIQGAHLTLSRDSQEELGMQNRRKIRLYFLRRSGWRRPFDTICGEIKIYTKNKLIEFRRQDGYPTKSASPFDHMRTIKIYSAKDLIEFLRMNAYDPNDAFSSYIEEKVYAKEKAYYQNEFGHANVSCIICSVKLGITTRIQNFSDENMSDWWKKNQRGSCEVYFFHNEANKDMTISEIVELEMSNEAGPSGN